MQPLKLADVYSTAIEHAFEKYKTERWTNIIRYPVDCLDILYATDVENLAEVHDLLKLKKLQAPKTYQSLFDEPLATLDKSVLHPAPSTSPLGRLNTLLKLWQQFANNETKAQIASYHAINDARKRGKANREWQCWEDMRLEMGKIELREISAEEAYALRLELNEHGHTTLYNAYIAVLHAGPGPRPSRSAGALHHIETYRTLAKKERDARKDHAYHKIADDFNLINYSDNLMEAVFTVLEEWKHTLMDAIDRTMVFEHENGPDADRLIVGDAEIAYQYWRKHTYAKALASLQDLTAMIVED